MRALIILCFYFPLVTNLLNVQGFIAIFISATLAQVFAYVNVLLLFVGLALILKKTEKFALLIKVWIAFFLCYYAFAILANLILNTEPNILRTTVALSFFIGFAFLLSIPEQIATVGKILAFAFFTSTILLIFFSVINFSMDFSGVYQYKLDRAGGVYGDANNAAVSSILSFIFIKFSIQPKNALQKSLKLIALAISAYALLLTFSNTGFVVFLIVLALSNSKIFSKTRILFALIFLPIALIGFINWALTLENLTMVQKARINNVVNILTLQTENVKLSSRDHLFKKLMNSIYENPIMGNGVDFSVIIRGHNTIFGVWADAGILTFLLFLGLLFLYFKKALLANKDIRFYALSILVTLTIFMLSLQTIINQGYILVVFCFLGYLLADRKKLI